MNFVVNARATVQVSAGVSLTPLPFVGLATKLRFVNPEDARQRLTRAFDLLLRADFPTD